MKNIINRIKNDKVLFFLSILIIGIFLVLVIRITYSYLAASINEATGNLNIGSDTTDKLEFFEGNPIDLNVTSTTLPEGGGNYAQSTTYRAELTANSTTNSAEDSYYVYFNVTANTLNYTQEGNPEVILTVFQDDTEITNIDGLTYGTYNGVTGFDVTEATGLFTVASDYAITSNSSTDATVQNWTFTLTYLNQNYDQSGNYGNNMNVEFIMTKEEKELTLADLCNGLTLSECITTQVYTGTDGENGIYYHDGEGTYGTLEAGDNSYRFSGGDYEIVEAYLGTYNQIYGEIIKRYCDGTEDTTFIQQCSGNITYELAYDSNNTQYATVSEALEQAVSDGYLTGDNIRNYVCFGSNETPCPEENLYRVIGIFGNQVKLIKADYTTSEELGTNGDYSSDASALNMFMSMLPYRGNNDLSSYYWNDANYDLANQETGYRNLWSYSQLNTVNLNTNYLNSLGTTWQNMIEDTTWYVGGVDSNTVMSGSNRASAKTIYEAELGEGKVTIAPFEPYTAKIGLMYASDFVYGANPEYWGTVDYSSQETEVSKWFTSNWLDLGLVDWTVSRDSDLSYIAWYVNLGVFVASGVVGLNDIGVRPSFSLSSSTTYVSGSGTADDPFQIKL